MPTGVRELVDQLDAWQAEWLMDAWATMAGFTDTMDRVQRTLMSVPKRHGHTAFLASLDDHVPQWEQDLTVRLGETPIYPDHLERAREELAAHLAEHPVQVHHYPSRARGRA